ncbi:MAG TPA: PRC-barrel domain-containing protein [Noviherbaspirillum sp.]|uniref:PRC-barrel domain-containing protein n=1 Tax=Noviherbaspirillum sp. TaxID=1926288 RepID=UPI002F92C255
MLHSLKTLDGFVIGARDGNLGRVKDIYFDDSHWTVRFLEVDTGGLMGGRRVLISPHAVIAVDWEGAEVTVDLTRQQVHDSPGIDSAVPVARQHEAAIFNYYGYPYYWTGPFIWGYTAVPTMEIATARPPVMLQDDAQDQAQEDLPEQAADGVAAADPHLRSKDEVVGYGIQAADDYFGRVADFLIDEQTWSIRLIVVDTKSWWPGGKVLVSPARVKEVSWEERSLVLDLTRDQVEHSPEYDPAHPPAEDDFQEIYRGAGHGPAAAEPRRPHAG